MKPTKGTGLSRPRAAIPQFSTYALATDRTPRTGEIE